MADLFCNPITGNLFQRACDLLKGGLFQEIFVANLGEIDAISFNVDGEVDTITMKTNTVTTNPYNWFRIIAKKQSNGILNTVVVGTNTSFISQSIDFQVKGFDTENKKAFESMINGQAVFIGKDSAKVSHILGHESGAELQDGATIGTGIALDDLVGGTAQFVAQETFVTPTVAAGTTISVLNVDGSTIDTVTI